MKRNKYDNKYPGVSSKVESGDYRFFYMGDEKSVMYEAGIMINKRMKNKNLVIIQMCMPMSQHTYEEVEECYQKIEELREKKRRHAYTVII